MEGFEDIVKEFLIESYDNLDKLDDDLLALENNPGDRDRLASLFRTVHTIKGTSGFLGLPVLERVTHVGENLLVPLRDGDLTLDSAITESLLQMFDAIREILEHVEADGGEGDKEYEDLIARLENTLGQASDARSPAMPEVDSETIDPCADEGPDSGCEPSVGQAAPSATRHGVAESSVRIDVDLLDEMINLVGELVLVRNQVNRLSGMIDDNVFLNTSQRLNLITSELQERVMKTRMQPIGNVLGKLPRVVRDLAAACGKQVQLKTQGEETELDKTVLDAVRDPLTHLVRNAIDHGVEPVENRMAKGKPATGSVTVKAFHESGQVIIEVSDDGAGIDPDRVRQKAIEKHVLSASEAKKFGERELIDLILMPGFSTASQVTTVSGRGVGMDVVKTNIEAIGGTLDIQSSIGQGTVLRIKIPLTLAIIPVLIIKSSGDQYAIPQVNLQELVRVECGGDGPAVEFIHETPVMRLRDQLIPLLDLNQILEVDAEEGGSGANDFRSGGSTTRRDGSLNVVVLRAESQTFGLIVDEIADTQEIVVKSLDGLLSLIPVFAGATIMGDGTIALILDIPGLAQTGGVSEQTLADHNLVEAELTESQSVSDGSLLVLDRADGTRAAITLSSVVRLEKFMVADLERVGQQYFIQYRGDILPLISLDGSIDLMFGGTAIDSSQELQAVIYRQHDRCVGVIIAGIVDIVKDQLTQNQITQDRIERGHFEHDRQRASGIATSASGDSCKRVINGRVTQILDLDKSVEANSPGPSSLWSAANNRNSQGQ